MIYNIFIKEHISVDFDLDVHYRYLISRNLYLVWLTEEAESFNWIFQVAFSVLLLSFDESELNISIEITTLVLEWDLKLLDSICFLDSERDYLLICLFVCKLSHALDEWVIEVSDEENIKFLWCTLCNWYKTLVAYLLFRRSC